jgi:DNA-binding NarL/FixJ family response regulator
VSTIRVLIVDDQPLARAGFKAVLEATGAIDVVAEAENGEHAVELTRRHDPDVVLMDIRMPGMDGIEATRRMPRQKVLILTTFGLDEYIIEALRAGASGFLLKDAPPPDMLSAIRAVATGDAVVAPSVTRRLLSEFARHLPVHEQPSDARIESLTPRERELLVEVARGLSNAEIADQLVLSVRTVETHLYRAMHKLGVSDRRELRERPAR